MTCSVLTIISLACLSTSVVQANTKGHKRAKKSGFMKVDAAELHGNLQQAMSEALDVDHEVEFDTIRERLRPTFKALPKNAEGLVELHVMEHAIHRYFMQHYSLSLKPFEPHRPLKASELRSSEVLGERAPAFVEEILKGRFYHNGFAFEDAVSMIATLEHFLYDDSVRRLRQAYQQDGLSEDAELSITRASQTILTFIELVNEEGEQHIVPKRRGSMAYNDIQSVIGELERVMYKRRKAGQKSGRGLLSDKFTFKDVAQAAHSVTLGAIALFSECDGLRKHMASFDKRTTGRAKLSDLYWADPSTSDFAFGESKDWLRRMGVLDESATWMGPQVIIPNYIQAASNCVMTTSLFRQCCPNRKCQNMLHDLESILGKPSAKALEIWPAIMKATKHGLDSQTAMENMGDLMMKLDDVAKHHQGEIPIHGRLFAQFLHYLDPQECPYPYKRGEVEVVNAKDCGAGCIVDSANLKEAGEAASKDAKSGDREGTAGEDDWLGQWTLDEELITARAPVEESPFSDTMRRAAAMSKAVIVAAVFFCLSGFVILKVAPSLLSTRTMQGKAQTITWSPEASWSQKSHLV